MAIYAVGNEHDSYDVFQGAFLSGSAQNTDTGNRFALAANETNQFLLKFNTAVSAFWSHFRIQMSSTSTSNTSFINWYNTTTGKKQWRIIIGSASGYYILQYSTDGTAWTTIGSTWYMFGALTLDVYLKAGSSGEAKIFINGQIAMSVTGNFPVVDTNTNSVIVGGIPFSTTYWNSLIIASESTINWTTDVIEPNGAGTYSEWTGSYTDIDDTTTYNEADYITTNTPNARFTAALADTTVTAGRVIKAVSVACRGMIASGPAFTTLSFMARSGGTDYTLADVGLTAGNGIASNQYVMELDPSGSAWTQSTVNALELGLKVT